MSSHLPTQQPVPNTYYAVAGISAFITRMRADDKEAVVSGIWVDILRHIFPSATLYQIRPEQFSRRGPADLCVLQLVTRNNQRHEYQFLVVQCKKPSGESQDAVWAGAKDQIKDYLAGLKPLNIPRRVYGIVAVGRWAQFVEYNRGTKSLDALNGERDKLHIERQCLTIQGLLEYIEANHQ
ncbi:hypothetical protein FQN54_004570 [Arachnomyces sp. PD_36]|nr:hypothetical protein FQN54_004570 [Arachnomyces sp. PD_36]